MQILFKTLSDLRTTMKLFLLDINMGYQETDLVLDMRFLTNPFYQDKLKHFDGKNAKVINFVKKQEYFYFFFDRLLILFKKIL